MSRLRASVALLLALWLPAAALAAPIHARHHHHRHHHGRLVGVGPGWDLYGPSAGYEGYDGGYSGYGSFGGQIYTRNSGGVNSMANDFGTSGVLGHTNGMPATGR